MDPNRLPERPPSASQGSGGECCCAAEPTDTAADVPAAPEAEWPRCKRELDALLASLGDY